MEGTHGEIEGQAGKGNRKMRLLSAQLAGPLRMPDVAEAIDEHAVRLVYSNHPVALIDLVAQLGLGPPRQLGKVRATLGAHCSALTAPAAARETSSKKN